MSRLRARLALAAAFVALVSARVLVEGRAELAAGEAALARDDADEGVRRLRRAAHLYLPGSPYTRRAYDDLEAFARASETRGQHDRALVAWRALRSSALGTRWLVVPYRDRLARANHRIAHLMALGPAAPEDRDTPPARLEEKYLALLAEDRAPEPAWVLVMGAGLALWLGAAFWAARHGWDDDDRARARALGWAAATVVAGMALFVLGLARA